jgi:hypothetical protein
MERDAVRVDITKRDMSTNLAKLAKAKALLHALDDERPHAAAATLHTKPVGKETSREGSTSSSDATRSAATHPDKPAASLASSPSAEAPSADALTHAAAAAPATPATTAPRQQATKQLVGAAAAEAAAAAKVKLAAHTTPPTTNKKTASQGVSHLVEGQQHVANMKQHVANKKLGKQSARASPARALHPPAKRASFASSFSRAVDAIGVAKTPVAEDAEVDEGGSVGREMELASSASAVLTPRGIVAQDKPYRPSASEEIASLVYESSKNSARTATRVERQQRGAHLDATATQDSALPFIERRSIWNW